MRISDWSSDVCSSDLTSALDPLVAAGILKLLMRLQAETQVSYLFITHDIATVRAIADSIAVMYRGRVVRFGPKSGVLSPPFDDYTDLLLKSVPEIRLGWLEERSEEHTPGLQSLMRSPYAVFSLNKKKDIHE